MKNIGIVAEYNPFHNGHLYHVQEAKRIVSGSAQDATCGVIAVMSGHYVQRGEPAFVDKWLRAECAVRAGVNLVLELPTAYAVSSAEAFSSAAVSLLEATGMVTHLAYGSEALSIHDIDAIADYLVEEPHAYKERLKDGLKKGLSFPAARHRALSLFAPEAQALQTPNAILAVEYHKALKRLKSQMVPICIPRKGPGYHSRSLGDRLSSATAIRSGYFEGVDLRKLGAGLPKSVVESLCRSPYAPVGSHNMSPLLFSVLRRMRPQDLKRYRYVSEGIEHRIHSAALESTSYPALVAAIQSKRYPQTRVQRMLTNIFLGIEPSQVPDACSFMNTQGYFRVLGFDATGRKMLQTMKRTQTLPIITALGKQRHLCAQIPLLALDIRAGDLYALLQEHPALRRGGRDYTEKPYMSF